EPVLALGHRPLEGEGERPAAALGLGRGGGRGPGLGRGPGPGLGLSRQYVRHGGHLPAGKWGYARTRRRKPSIPSQPSPTTKPIRAAKTASAGMWAVGVRAIRNPSLM